MREFNRFVPKKSHAAADDEDINLNAEKGMLKFIPDEYPAVPPCPTCTMSNIEFYFGKLWWLWVVAIVIYLVKK